MDHTEDLDAVLQRAFDESTKIYKKARISAAYWVWQKTRTGFGRFGQCLDPAWQPVHLRGYR